jgi:type IV pilus assembly protein PilV
MVEVLVAMIVIAVGMLGIAKMQALAYANVGTSSLRSLAAIQASSLAAAMLSNPGYWSAAATPLTVTINKTAITSTDATLVGTFDCTSGGANAPCTPGHLAAYDLLQWVTALNTVLPNPTGTISCPTPVAGTPIGCTIQISWFERTVAVTTPGATANMATMTAPTYTLYVEP